MSLPAQIDLEAYRGDDWTITGQVFDEEPPNDPVSDYFTGVTGASIEVRKTRSDTPVVSFTQAVSEISFSGSFFTLTKAAASTDVPGGTYLYDMQATKGGKTITLVRGTFRIIDDVTQ